MDSWERCRRHPLRHGQRPRLFQSPTQELQAFAESTLWFRRNSAETLGSNPRANEEESFSCVTGCSTFA
eukprot:11717215-Alexandrium_andersonii.AAC.1